MALRLETFLHARAVKGQEKPRLSLVQKEQILKNGDRSKGFEDVNGINLVLCRAFPPTSEMFHNKMLEIF